MTLFEVREEWEGWLANETAQCRKQNNLQKRCCSPLHPSLPAESSAVRAACLPKPLHRNSSAPVLLS